MKVSKQAMQTLDEKLLSMHSSLARWERRLEESPGNEYFEMQVNARRIKYDLWWEIAKALK